MVERVAVVADVHGVLPALEAVLAEPDVRSADLVVVCGDVAAGPLPNETMEVLTAELGPRGRWLRGNTDRGLVELVRGHRSAAEAGNDLSVWAVAQLTSDHVEVLAALPLTIELDVAEIGTTVFCHGTPRADDEVVLVDSPVRVWEAVLADLDPGVRAVVGGHTHMPFSRLLDGRLLVNAGSVGMPYGGRGASWAMLGRGLGVSLRRTHFDVAAACDRIAAGSSYPAVEGWLDAYLRAPPSDLQALDAFRPRVPG